MSEPAREIQIRQYHDVNEQGHLTDVEIANTDGNTSPKAIPDSVTPSLAERVWDEFLVDLEDYGIEVTEVGDV